MIIIGEKINATRKSIARAIQARDAQAVAQVASAQAAAGADYLDLNGGDPDPAAEVENMKWLVELVQQRLDTPLCIDSANPQAVEAGLALAKAKPIVNSVSLETERLQSFLPIISRHECMVIALCVSDAGMPTGADDRVATAGGLVEAITGAGKSPDQIIVDPCFVPVATQPEAAAAVCQAIARIRREYPQVHVGGGLSNVSFGLPNRRLINQAMLVWAIAAGMDAVIIDPTAPGVVGSILAAEVISGADEWCAKYVGAYRAGKLD